MHTLDILDNYLRCRRTLIFNLDFDSIVDTLMFVHVEILQLRLV